MEKEGFSDLVQRLADLARNTAVEMFLEEDHMMSAKQVRNYSRKLVEEVQEYNRLRGSGEPTLKQWKKVSRTLDKVLQYSGLVDEQNEIVVQENSDRISRVKRPETTNSYMSHPSMFYERKPSMVIDGQRKVVEMVVNSLIRRVLCWRAVAFY